MGIKEDLAFERALRHCEDEIIAAQDAEESARHIRQHTQPEICGCDFPTLGVYCRICGGIVVTPP
jgi:hypothetical protein